MSDVQAARPASMPGQGRAAGWAALGVVPCASASPSPHDRAFITLHNAYRSYGGLLRLRGPVPGTAIRLEPSAHEVARFVDSGDAFGFYWYDALWVPRFQFEDSATKLAAGPQRIVAELGRSFDGWEIAGWFVRANAFLADRKPVECLASSLSQVLEAARADRLVANG